MLLRKIILATITSLLVTTASHAGTTTTSLAFDTGFAIGGGIEIVPEGTTFWKLDLKHQTDDGWYGKLWAGFVELDHYQEIDLIAGKTTPLGERTTLDVSLNYYIINGESDVFSPIIRIDHNVTDYFGLYGAVKYVAPIDSDAGWDAGTVSYAGVYGNFNVGRFNFRGDARRIYDEVNGGFWANKFQFQPSTKLRKDLVLDFGGVTHWNPEGRKDITIFTIGKLVYTF